MKSILSLFFIFLFCFVVYAESIEVFDLKGDVYVKILPTSSYERAKIGIRLNKDSTIKTGKGSFCTIIFDDNPKNILTIKEDSNIVIKNLKPVNLYLISGGVFALVRDLKDVKEFNIQTPTAIAGVRGTGEGISFINSNTEALCFEGQINIDALDTSGNKKGSEVLNEGYGVIVDSNGNFSEIFSIEKEDLEEWQDFLDYLNVLTQEDIQEDTNLFDIKDEQKDNYKESNFEDRRKDKETRTEDEGNSKYVLGGG